MSRIGSSGQHDASGFCTAEDRFGKDKSRQSRFDDGSKGLGSRDGELGQRRGSDARAAAEHGTDARANAFGRSLEEALGDHKAVPGRKDQSSVEHQHGTDADVSALLASLSSQPPALAPAPTHAGTKSGSHDAGATSGRHVGLKGLWAKEPDAGRVEASSAATKPDSGHPARHAADSTKAKRVLHLMAEIDPANAAQAVGPQPSATSAPPSSENSAATAAAPQPGTAERVERVADRVAQAIRSEDAVPPGQTVTLDIPLDVTGAGAQSLTVSLTAAGVDVSLARDAGDASAALLGAAHDLAARLQRRFPNRTVRIYDAVRPSFAMAFGQVGAAMATPLSDTDDQ